MTLFCCLLIYITCDGKSSTFLFIDLFFSLWFDYFSLAVFNFFFLIALVNLIVISFAIIFIKFLLFGYILFYMFFKISSLLIIILVIQICIYLFHGTTGLQHFQYLFCLFSVYNLIFNNI